MNLFTTTCAQNNCSTICTISPHVNANIYEDGYLTQLPNHVLRAFFANTAPMQCTMLKTPCFFMIRLSGVDSPVIYFSPVDGSAYSGAIPSSRP